MPEKFKNKYRISSTRLPYWDYGWNGAYFITICTKNRVCFFGEIKNGKMIFSEIGRLAHKFWNEIQNHFTFVVLDEFVIMPNHVHGIIIIDKPANEHTTRTTPAQNRFRNPGKNNISSIIGSYKSVVSKYAHQIDEIFNWQPRFYDRIIRNAKEFYKIRKYIRYNPAKWENDKNNQDGLWT